MTLLVLFRPRNPRSSGSTPGPGGGGSGRRLGATEIRRYYDPFKPYKPRLRVRTK